MGKSGLDAIGADDEFTHTVNELGGEGEGQVRVDLLDGVAKFIEDRILVFLVVKNTFFVVEEPLPESFFGGGHRDAPCT